MCAGSAESLRQQRQKAKLTFFIRYCETGLICERRWCWCRRGWWSRGWGRSGGPVLAQPSLICGPRGQTETGGQVQSGAGGGERARRPPLTGCGVGEVRGQRRILLFRSRTAECADHMMPRRSSSSDQASPPQPPKNVDPPPSLAGELSRPIDGRPAELSDLLTPPLLLPALLRWKLCSFGSSPPAPRAPPRAPPPQPTEFIA